MEKEEIVEPIPHKRIEVDVNKIKKFEDHFTYRANTEINPRIKWYDFVFPADLVNCETKVFASIADSGGTCATVKDTKLKLYNIAAYDGLISLKIYLSNTSGQNRTAQINFLVFTWG
jgi:hypothetical protein